MTVPLSVIIPTYNRAGHVRHCLTMLKQVAIPNLEIIVADDGSTDNTAAVIQEVAPNAIHQWLENSGTPAGPRNRGFEASHGKYVSFLDCDDSWIPGVPEKAMAWLEDHPEVDVLFADARMGNPTDGYTSWIDYAGQKAFFELPHVDTGDGFRIMERGPFFHRIAERNAVFIGACIMRREAFAEAGMFDTTLCGAADWELWLRLSTRFTYAFLNKPMAVYARHEDNMSDNHDLMVGEFCQTLRYILQKCEVTPPQRRHLLDRLRHMLFHYAYIAYDDRRYRPARSRFWQALRAGNTELKTLAYWMACCLPQSLLQGLRNVKQMGLPGRLAWTESPTPAAKRVG